MTRASPTPCHNQCSHRSPHAAGAPSNTCSGTGPGLSGGRDAGDGDHFTPSAAVQRRPANEPPVNILVLLGAAPRPSWIVSKPRGRRPLLLHALS
ncbi:hypothetical protein E2C01_070672 [Portunus trituberculatus]|uniref:Uncharacterized protein n=1 Tax=Portunus trituberculatus TaxID=210409 RepID=A0A5B7I294_PORTR|nr:hypothetical protein [Portunus trituberculatus]